MKFPIFSTYQQVGLLLVFSAFALFIPYLLLVSYFDYPNILRKDTTQILIQFHQGGTPLIFIWLAFAFTGFPLIPAYTIIGSLFEDKILFVRWVTKIGIIGLVVQMIGLLRWVFVVPVLSQLYISGDEATKSASVVAFKVLHQYAGVLLGEHLGQFFTIVWMFMISVAFHKLKLMPKWVNVWGYITSLIYILGQGELLAMVIPSFPFWDFAGFLGSTLWLIWLIIVGIFFIKKN